MTSRSSWAVVLAGGDGTRLRPLTRFLTDDNRPKQFCPLAGNRSLLADTRDRVADIADAGNTLFVVTKEHERFYRSDLGSAPPWQLLEQPVGRGTTAAIAFGVASLRTRAPRSEEAVVGFFPADHYYADRMALRQALATAYAAAARHPARIVLLGAQATRPETEYGWVQPGAPLSSGRRGGPAVREVSCFCEKPVPDVAASLLWDRWLWNTFILVGRLDAFVSLLDDAAPDVWRRFSPLGSWSGRGEHTRMIAETYTEIGPSDFSREVLATRTTRLAVIELPAQAGWTDLGQPGRALDLLIRHDLRRPALRRPTGFQVPGFRGSEVPGSAATTS